MGRAQPVEVSRATARPDSEPPDLRVPTFRRQRVSRSLAALVLGLCLVRVATATILVNNPDTYDRQSGLTGDIRRWHAISNAAGVPYRDVHIEYPPLTWAAGKLLDAPSLRTETERVVWSQVALDLLTAAALAYGWGRRAALAYLLLGLALVAWPFIYVRLDLLPVVLATWGLAWTRRHHPLVGGATVGLACLAKLWPLALLPLMAVTRRGRALAAALVAGGVGFVAWVVLTGTRGIRDVVTFREAKGWQIESVVGALVRAIGSAPVRAEEGAWRVAYAAPMARDVGDLAFVVLAVVVCRLLTRAGAPGPGLVDGVGPVTLVAGLIVCSPIFSPQYAVWLLPFAAIAAAYGEYVVAGCTTLTCALSTVLMYVYEPVVHGATWAEAVLMTRNLALVGVVIVGVATLMRARRANETGGEVIASLDSCSS
jgi:Glycosyltransferase family 87